MQLDPRDASYVWDMLDNATTVRRVAERITRAQLLGDRESQLVLERALEIIGEAAGRVSQPFRVAHPEIPWARIVGLRNVIVHEYGDVNYDIIWRIATRDVPALIEALERIVPPPDRPD
jgi:uncharacterized protein with HEPN domain